MVVRKKSKRFKNNVGVYDTGKRVVALIVGTNVKLNAKDRQAITNMAQPFLRRVTRLLQNKTRKGPDFLEVGSEEKRKNNFGGRLS